MVNIEGKTIGNGNPIYIVFEVGPTHNGLDSAKRLVKAAADAGADAVKFQILDAKRLVRDPSMMVEYGYLASKKPDIVERYSEPLRDVLVRRGMERHEWIALKAYADELGITFFATASYVEELNLLDELGCKSVKVASLDINHHPFLREIAKRDFCIQLDTGNATLGEIEAAIDILIDEGADNFIIHHCPSGYPARLQSINLRTITTLKQMFNCPIAFSDHTSGWDMDIAAAALGVNLLEKTITEDRCCRSPEHVMSLEPHECEAFVNAIRDLEIAMGGTRRRLSKEESDRRAGRRRSAYIIGGGKSGQRVRDLEIDYSRPGKGLQPDVIEQYLDAKLNKDLEDGHVLNLHDLEW
ncbi:N-acetylneuraminate synthase family protein [Neptuniibacter sp. 1_MG-2023]|uniref:N-acetylneuraminate synthase family protein n=1 Tax=Neptuniibacter sp. 1_MG-2023 TaxID=3062662 RepID=UPI0026E14652|nr:N-acetylneuraminate synthase family protein [Neptuniibacter sp. 1_MG-2023]MDO6592773.1 N-acetylneuraminate synthase family protein [Neptuniibacter sp. 1_MG-2023]